MMAGGVTNIDDDYDGLGDLFPSEPRPESPPPTFESYELETGETLDIRLISKHSLWAHRLWNAAKVLVQHLEHHQDLFRGKSVCELGAGAALPAIVCALNGAQRVIATDYPEDKLVENMAFNARAAGLGPPNFLSLGLRWGDNAHHILQANDDGRFDVLILSDLVFNHSQHAALIKTCDDLLHAHGTCLIFFTHHVPHKAEKDLQFLQRLRHLNWTLTEIVTQRMTPMFADDDGDLDMRCTVHGYTANKPFSLP